RTRRRRPRRMAGPVRPGVHQVVTTKPATLKPAAVGRPSNLLARQNEPAHLERLRAYSYRYKVAQRWRTLRLSGTLAFAAVAPVIAWRADKGVSDVLAAVAA